MATTPPRKDVPISTVAPPLARSSRLTLVIATPDLTIREAPRTRAAEIAHDMSAQARWAAAVAVAVLTASVALTIWVGAPAGAIGFAVAILAVVVGASSHHTAGLLTALTTPPTERPSNTSSATPQR
jgi:hypothetical protein